MKRLNVFQSLAVLFLFSQIAWGGVPQVINFQGILKDGSGNPVADNSYSVTFTIYDDPSAGNVKWQETQSVTTTNGLFTVLLGSTTAVPDSVFYDTSRYIGIAISPDPEMTPRQRLSSVGYSSVSSQWTSAGQNLFTLSGKVGIGESSPLNTLTIGSNGAFTSTGLFPGILMGTTDFQTKQILIGRDENNFVQLAYADEDPSTAARLLVEGNHPLYITTGGSLLLGTQTNNPLELQTNNTARMHITGDGNVGIGTTSPSAKLEVLNSVSSAAAEQGVSGIVSNSSTGSAFGGIFTASSAGTGIKSGVRGNASSASGNPAYGVYGEADNSSTGDAYGGFFNVPSSGGAGASYGVYSAVASVNGWGFFTPNNAYLGGNVGIGTTSPSQKLDVVGNAAVSGSLTIGGGPAIVSVLSGSGSLDFPSIAAQTSFDLTIPVTGATLGDVVSIGVPSGSVVADAAYTAWVSAANTVTIRFYNYSSSFSPDPAGGTFRAMVTRF